MLSILDTAFYFVIKYSTNSLIPFVRHTSVNSQQLTKEEMGLTEGPKKASSRVPEIQPYTTAENQDDIHFTYGGHRR